MSENVNIEQVIAELGKGLRVYKAFEHADAVIRRLAIAEQTERETTARVAALREEAVARERGLEQQRVESAEFTAGMEKALTESEEKAAAMVAEASRAAEDIKAAAEREADAARDARDEALDAERAARAAVEALEVQRRAAVDTIARGEAVSKAMGK